MYSSTFNTMTFTIPGKPVAKGRPRMTRKGITYTPKETVRFENLVRVCAYAARVKMIDGPVRLRIQFYWPCKGQPRKKPRDVTWKTTRPDLDNAVKAVADSLNGIAYRDDSQVVTLIAMKHHAAQGEAPRTVVHINRATLAF